MEANFELFEEGPVLRHGVRVHVTLSKDLKLFFNAKALEAIGIVTPLGDAPAGTPSAAGVALMFDKRQKLIGVMPSDVGRKHTFPLRTKASMGRARYVSAKNFCRKHGIKPAETMAFTDAAVNRDGVLVLDLNAVVSVGRRQQQ